MWVAAAWQPQGHSAAALPWVKASTGNGRLSITPKSTHLPSTESHQMLLDAPVPNGKAEDHLDEKSIVLPRQKYLQVRWGGGGAPCALTARLSAARRGWRLQQAGLWASRMVLSGLD